MTNAKPLRNCIRKSAILDHQNSATHQALNAFDKVRKLLVGLRADRTLRAMLENKNETVVRPLDELFEIAILS